MKESTSRIQISKSTEGGGGSYMQADILKTVDIRDIEEIKNILKKKYKRVLRIIHDEHFWLCLVCVYNWF